MKYIILGVVFCIAVGVTDALWCFKCSGSECETPDTNVEGVYITECSSYDSICYKQVITNYGVPTYSRGCKLRKSDCQPVCLGEPDHEVCEICCDSNLCNSAGAVRVNYILIAVAVFFCLFQFLH
ncbi:uncharacterized protein [Diadema setosum]|uniref:uncharacterized protein n=1 Tax=Diadema setosum TaxID=31175 RepID=UPI003B3AD4FA